MDAQTAVESAVQQTIDDGPEIGVQVAAYLHGELVVDVSCGVADLEDGREVDGETIFTVFSATKGVAATALHIQHTTAENIRRQQASWFAWSDPISYSSLRLLG